jgi:hypothetical protein
MKIEINSAKLIIEFVDEETGELFTREATLGDFKEVKKTTTRTKKSKDDGSTEPKVILLDGKIQLNSRAVELCGWEPEAKIDIRFDKKGKKMTPVMGEDPSKGNRLTKTYTISCRGSKHDNLAGYGDTFEVIPYEGKDGYFKLKGNVEKEDDIIDIPEEITNSEENDIDIDDESGVDIPDFNLEF